MSVTKEKVLRRFRLWLENSLGMRGVEWDWDSMDKGEQGVFQSKEIFDEVVKFSQGRPSVISSGLGHPEPASEANADAATRGYRIAISDWSNGGPRELTDEMIEGGCASEHISRYRYDAPPKYASLVGHGLLFSYNWCEDGTHTVIQEQQADGTWKRFI